MDIKVEKSFTLTQSDVRQVIAEYISKTQGVKVTMADVNLNIDPGSRYGGQFDEGTAASLTVTVKVKDKPSDDLRGPWDNKCTTGSSC